MGSYPSSSQPKLNTPQKKRKMTSQKKHRNGPPGEGGRRGQTQPPNWLLVWGGRKGRGGEGRGVNNSTKLPISPPFFHFFIFSLFHFFHFSCFRFFLLFLHFSLFFEMFSSFFFLFFLCVGFCFFCLFRYFNFRFLFFLQLSIFWSSGICTGHLVKPPAAWPPPGPSPLHPDRPTTALHPDRPHPDRPHPDHLHPAASRRYPSVPSLARSRGAASEGVPNAMNGVPRRGISVANSNVQHVVDEELEHLHCSWIRSTT